MIDVPEAHCPVFVADCHRSAGADETDEQREDQICSRRADGRMEDQCVRSTAPDRAFNTSTEQHGPLLVE
jgi:hypothetical protein